MNAINKIDTTHMTNAAHIGFMKQTLKRAKKTTVSAETDTEKTE